MPRPLVRSIRPSRTSSLSAWRMVIRLPPLRELALGGHAVAGTPFACVEGRLQVSKDLVVQGDGPALELESSHSVLVRP